MDFLKTRNGKICAGVVAAILVAVAIYCIVKRMQKKENFDASTPLYGIGSSNANYDDFGVMAGGDAGNATYSPLGFDNRDGSAANIVAGNYY
jgi:hypothetical protein